MAQLFRSNERERGSHWSVHELEVDTGPPDEEPMLVFDASSGEYHAVLSREEAQRLHTAIGVWLMETKQAAERGNR